MYQQDLYSRLGGRSGMDPCRYTWFLVTLFDDVMVWIQMNRYMEQPAAILSVSNVL